jgi:hypothetical protein
LEYLALTAEKPMIVDTCDDENMSAVIDGRRYFLGELSRSQLIRLAKHHIRLLSSLMETSAC